MERVAGPGIIAAILVLGGLGIYNSIELANARKANLHQRLETNQTYKGGTLTAFIDLLQG